MANRTDKTDTKMANSRGFSGSFPQHWKLVLTLCSICIPAIGMYSIWYKGILLFGVNILVYSHPSDFLIAALNMPFGVAMFVLLAAGVAIALLRPSQSPRTSRLDKALEFLSWPLRLIAGIIFVLAPVVIHSFEYASHLLCSEDGVADVTIRTQTAPKRIVVVETTSSFVLGIAESDREGRCPSGRGNAVQKPSLLVIPHSAIDELRFVK